MPKSGSALFIAIGLVVVAMPLGTLSWVTPVPFFAALALIGLGFAAITNLTD